MKFHLAASGKSQGLMVKCPAKKFCTLRTSDGMPVHHGDFVYSKDANNWNVISQTVQAGDKEPLETSTLAMDTLEHRTSLDDSVVQAVVENETAHQLGHELPNDQDELKANLVGLAPKAVVDTFDYGKDRFKKMLPLSTNPHTDVDTLDAIADQAIKHGDRELMRNVARNRNTSAKTLYALSKSKDSSIRLEVAKNRNTNQITLQDLSTDEEKQIKLAVQNNEYFRKNTDLGGQQDTRRISKKVQDEYEAAPESFKDHLSKIRHDVKATPEPVREPRRTPEELAGKVTVRHVEPRKKTVITPVPKPEPAPVFADEHTDEDMDADAFKDHELETVSLEDIGYSEEPPEDYDAEDMDSADYSAMADEAEEKQGFFSRMRGFFSRGR